MPAEDAYREIQESIHTVAALRFPRFEQDVQPRAKIDALEGYLLETAVARDVLEEARITLEDAYELIDEEWLKLTGWEVYLHGKPKSQVEIDEAKRQAEPTLFHSRRRCQKLLRQIGNQVRRLEKDDAACSRAYTMMTGS
ncbi:MAG TPA: hypothetical protein VN903_15410 [Polyangia bacterium]|nr:hypothetical protein [Polyangia bacterium]